jgi:quercetin dioxygenase-like cupin family protein
VVTGHDLKGRSVVLEDRRAPRVHAIPGAVFHELWSTSEMPAPVRAVEPAEPTDGPLLTPPPANGTIVRLVDLEPRSLSPMHRTESVDYGVVLAGEVTLVLDDGTATSLATGDVVVQRGTDHAWANPGDEPARMLFVLVDGRFDDELRGLLPEDTALFDHALDV